MNRSITLLDRTHAVRHPEKAHRPNHPKRAKPPWIKVRAPNSLEWERTRAIVREHRLVTVCEEASCPNIGECWSKRHATMMIMGDTCTRACAFCNVRTGLPNPLDADEPFRIAQSVAQLGLAHVVITSVDRDDLADGGAQHFASTITAIREQCPDTTIEVLTPDFLRKPGALERVIEAKPDVFNHNLETVPALYRSVRPGARYYHSLKILEQAKILDPNLFTKSGLMVGMGETREDLFQVMDDLRCAQVDFLTLGQYLQPTPKHHPVHSYITPETFESYKIHAYSKGFVFVAASPLTRSSYHADEDFKRLKERRQRIYDTESIR